MITIKDKKNCTGCSACASVCPKHCITLTQDEEGFAYPSVNLDACIHCDLCEKVCPVLHPGSSSTPSQTLAVVSNDDEIRYSSSSGGVFSLLAQAILSKGGMVWGAVFDDSWRVIHQGTDQLEELWKFRGAKYVQSCLGDSFRRIRQILKEGHPVLFSGTPCQVAGLRGFLQKDYPNLYTVDLICHGVPSSKVFHRFLIEQVENHAIMDINFRHKSTGWRTYNLSLKYEDKGVVCEKRILRKDNVFMEGFISNLYLRPSCYHCPAKCNSSGSDVTLGDFWGIERYAPELDDQKGISVVLLHTAKGRALFEEIGTKIRLKEMTYAQALTGNASLEESSTLNPWRTIFFQDMESQPFSKLVRSFDAPSLDLRIRRKLLNLWVTWKINL